MKYEIPYDKRRVTFNLPAERQVDLIQLQDIPAAHDPLELVRSALQEPMGDVALEQFQGSKSAAIAISDKTRPVPNEYLLPPLLEKLEKIGLKPENIHLIIATGLHTPMPTDEFSKVLPTEIIKRYTVESHNCDQEENLIYLGETQRGTPVWVNNKYYQSDIRITVGNIAPHQFQGFSGGVKGAAVGLGGRVTVNKNHAMMRDSNSMLGQFETNPARQDIEEIGAMIGVHFALNAVLNTNKKIVHVLFGAPLAVLKAGIPLSKKISQVPVKRQYNLVITSPGGYPKDIDMYQVQKGLFHTGLIAKEGGTVILVAACPEGSGSKQYEDMMAAAKSHQKILDEFWNQEFKVGPHKAWQIARDSVRVRVILISEMDPKLAELLRFETAKDVDTALARILPQLPPEASIAIMPNASSTIPILE
jgi:nickel-dependent lactate racemase